MRVEGVSCDFFIRDAELENKLIRANYRFPVSFVCRLIALTRSISDANISLKISQLCVCVCLYGGGGVQATNQNGRHMPPLMSTHNNIQHIQIRNTIECVLHDKFAD